MGGPSKNETENNNNDNYYNFFLYETLSFTLKPVVDLARLPSIVPFQQFIRPILYTIMCCQHTSMDGCLVRDSRTASQSSNPNYVISMFYSMTKCILGRASERTVRAMIRNK